MIYVYYGVVSLIYLLVLSYSIVNYTQAGNERRKPVRFAIETYSVMASLMVFIYGLLQFNYLHGVDVPVRTLTSNYFYDVVNALTHLSAAVAIKMWLGVMGIRIHEKRVSVSNMSNKDETQD